MTNVKSIFKTLVVYILEAEAKLILRKTKPKIVAVTGSVGKTSTKDAIFTVLNRSFKTGRSLKSYNSELGVPLAILDKKSAWTNPLAWVLVLVEGFLEVLFPGRVVEWLVLEVGADRPGDIKKITKWLKPDIAVMTHLPDVPVHIEFFKDREEVVIEKLYLAHNLKKEGLLVINADDQTLVDKTRDLPQKKVMYGFSEGADVRASDLHILYNKQGAGEPIGLTFKVLYDGQTVPIRILNVLGRHQIYAVLASIAVGLAQGLNIINIADTLQTDYETPPGRLKIIAGVKNTTILDDTYNASPTAVEAGLRALNEIETTGRKIAVLGDMLELGEHTIGEHRRIGRLASEVADMIWTVGLRSKFIEEEALTLGFLPGKVRHFDLSTQVGKPLEEILQAGDVLLIKGSQGTRMEKIVEEVMAEPLKKGDLLCRQETEWQGR